MNKGEPEKNNAMLNKRILINQKVQEPRWMTLIVALALAVFAVIFVPFSYTAMPLWLIGLWLLAYALACLTMGFRSWVYEDGEGKHTLCIRDNYSRMNSCIAFEYITHAELCDYTLFKKDRKPTAFDGQPYHIVYEHFGYQGPGIIVCYDLPKYACSDSERRSWRIPGARAREIFELIRQSKGAAQAGPL